MQCECEEARAFPPSSNARSARGESEERRHTEGEEKDRGAIV